MLPIPIYFDLTVSVVATGVGLAVLSTKMGLFDEHKSTPVVTAMAIASGSLGWSIFALMAFAALTNIPLWAAPTNKWLGSWGYTSARLMIAIGWGLTLLHMSRFSEFMQLQREIDKNNPAL
jgi:hypothetical protein